MPFLPPNQKCQSTEGAIQICLLLLLFLKPTSTKPQAGKLGQTYKIMVATAIYSVTMVLWKETAFPHYYYYYYYYVAFNAPCVGYKDDESQAIS